MKIGLKSCRDKINERVPAGIRVTEVEFEGPELVIYMDDPKRFADEADLIRVLARDLPETDCRPPDYP